MSFFENNSVFFSPLMAEGDGPHGFNDKRNRNPNWTDHEIVRFLEILQEEDTMKDLMAQRNKQVFKRHSSVKLEAVTLLHISIYGKINSQFIFTPLTHVEFKAQEKLGFSTD